MLHNHNNENNHEFIPIDIMLLTGIIGLSFVKETQFENKYLKFLNHSTKFIKENAQFIRNIYTTFILNESLGNEFGEYVTSSSFLINNKFIKDNHESVCNLIALSFSATVANTLWNLIDYNKVMKFDKIATIPKNLSLSLKTIDLNEGLMCAVILNTMMHVYNDFMMPNNNIDKKDSFALQSLKECKVENEYLNFMTGFWITIIKNTGLSLFDCIKNKKSLCMTFNKEKIKDILINSSNELLSATVTNKIFLPEFNKYLEDSQKDLGMHNCAVKNSINYVTQYEVKNALEKFTKQFLNQVIKQSSKLKSMLMCCNRRAQKVRAD